MLYHDISVLQLGLTVDEW